MSPRKPATSAPKRGRRASSEDITIRGLQAQLQEREAIGAAVIETALDCIIVIDQTGAIVEFNSAAERTFGYARPSVLGRRIADVIIPPELREAHSAGFARYLATDEPHLLGRRVEVTALHADGRRFPVELAISEVRLGERRLFTAYLRDITERRRIEQVLRESELRFRSIAEAQPLPILILRRVDHTVLYANPAAGNLLGAGLFGRSLEDLVVDRAAARRLVGRLAAEDMADLPEIELQGQGNRIPATITARPLDYDGIPSIAVGIVDLTERKRAEAQIARQREALHQSEKLTALGSLLAGVAHELNNPLSVVIAQASLLEEVAGDPSVATRAGKIRLAADRCGRIVKTFLAMARQRPVARSETDINRLINDALEIANYGIRTAGITVVRDLAADLPMLWAEADQLSQVLLNLIINAQQAMADRPGPRRLGVATRFLPQHRAARIEISDSGGGIPSDIRQRIFEPFFTTKPVGSGTGIGLAVCHSIVTAHGGSIAVEDVPNGTCFVVTLPVGRRISRGVHGDAQSVSDLTGLHILVVDDETDIGESIRDLLRRDGHHVEVVDSGRAALERMAANDYDLILSDIRMADVSGLDLFRSLRQERPDLAGRLIFITGDTFGNAPATTVNGETIPVVEKPFTLEDLRTAMARRLDLA